MLSAKMEDYLKAIYRLEREDGGPVATSRLAEALDVTPPTATKMVENLVRDGFVEREKYKGAHLTPEGETVALEVLRHHRLLETYLSEHLGYDWADVHDEADRLEHHISEEFERRVAAMLGEPDRDPHGAPIPTADLDPIDDTPGRTLDDVDAGTEVVVERVRDGDPEVLAYLADVGLVPGEHVTVREVTPIGMLRLEIANEEVSLPTDVAASIRIHAPVEELA
jgi:DtxR family Mn-dependent transcriptional regulator